MQITYIMARVTRCGGWSTIVTRMKVVQDRQKSYVDTRRKELHFLVGDKVYLKVSPTKGEVKFRSTRKLKPRYICPFDIIVRVGDVTYELALPPNFEGVHNVFHVSML